MSAYCVSNSGQRGGVFGARQIAAARRPYAAGIGHVRKTLAKTASSKRSVLQHAHAPQVPQERAKRAWRTTGTTNHSENTLFVAKTARMI